MIDYREAVQRIDRSVQAFPGEPRGLLDAHGCYLAEDVHSVLASPPFDNSGVDGYARREEDLNGVSLRLVGVVQAGDTGAARWRAGETVKVLTGAAVPEGTAAVSMQEDCSQEADLVRFHAPSELGDHIRRRGEDFMPEHLLLGRGSWLSPAAMGALASAGVKDVLVSKKPRVTVITTGNELREVGQSLGPGQIVNSNGPALAAALSALGIRARVLHILDDRRSVDSALESAFESDVVLSCGGVSVGEFDLLKDAFNDFGVEEVFWSVAIKPGKPIYFGTRGETLVFGLPGNPVSTLVTYLLFARPAMLKLMGCGDPWPHPICARFEGEARKKEGRMEFLRGTFVEDSVRPVSGQGSHQAAGLATADCLIVFPGEAETMSSGQIVETLPIVWGLG